ncbi:MULTISPECIES: SMI1/KNR4 family protein [Pseudomonas]|uniref:SMI1/KNR4 family protein n=1 Tax=Pseudomonas TaxID=286 RepID=UPI002DBB2AF1|nr:SMI1/KNR4 family protein [Pseudomonas asiatica]MEB6589206.1 SMI1/KNR4 family protein [Pseudomonas asiatica]
MSYIDVLESEIIASGEDPACAGGTTDAVIADFEKALNVKFPLSYKLFLKKYGALSFAGDTYYGITQSGVEAMCVPNVAFATKSARADGAADESMIVVKASGYGPIYSIDTSILGTTGEPVIVETAFSLKCTKEKNIIYQSFELFIGETVRQAIREL